jgi:hypothetical protein
MTKGIRDKDKNTNFFVIINKTNTEKVIAIRGWVRHGKSIQNTTSKGDYKYRRKAGARKLMAMKSSTEHRKITCVN